MKHELAQVDFSVLNTYIHSEIADRFRRYVVEEEEEEADRAYSASSPALTVNEKMGHWYSKIPETPNEDLGDLFDGRDLEDATRYEGDDESHTGQPEVHFTTHRDCFVGSSAYDWLRDALLREILLTPASLGIRQLVLDCLRPRHCSTVRDSASYNVTFEMNWDPRNFIQRQMYAEPLTGAIGAAVTLTGSLHDFQALTASQYLSQTWPSIGDHIISVIEDVLGGKSGDEWCSKSSML